MPDPIIEEQGADGKSKDSDANHKKQHDLRVLASTLITAEQSLINNRMTWMMTFQGLLFASFALTASTTNDPEIKTIITDVVPYVGFFVASITLIGIIAALLSISNIKASLAKNLKPLGATVEDGIIPYGTPTASFLGRLTAYSFPVIIAVTWMIIAYRVHEIKIIKKVNKGKQRAVIVNIDTKSNKLNRLK